jgi:hypothetical protein
MVGLASCLLAASQFNTESIPHSSLVSVESQLNPHLAGKPLGNKSFQNIEFSPNQTNLISGNLDSDYLPPLTSEASNFSHQKQRPQFEPIELGAKPWFILSNKVDIEYAQTQPVPWFIRSGSSHSGRVSGWKESNISFNKHIYFI